MGCCDDKKYVSNPFYSPLSKRLLEFGNENIAPEWKSKYPDTSLWLFTFIDGKAVCPGCEDSFQEMVSWFQKYPLLTKDINNTKWIIEDDMDTNLICKDMGFTESPTNLICNRHGQIIDMVLGYPDSQWMTKYLLPLAQPREF